MPDDRRRATGFLITIPQPFLFKAKATVDVLGVNENFMGLGQVDPQSPNYVPNDTNISTQIHILESASIKGQVLKRLERELVPSSVPVFTDWLAKLRRKSQDMLGRTPQDPFTALRQALQVAGGSLNVQQVKGTRLIDISCESTIPDVAAQFANAVANEYIEQNLSSKLNSLQQSMEWFTNQLKKQHDKVEEAEARLAAATKASMSGNRAENTLAASRAAALEQELANLQSERIRREAQLETANSGKNSGAESEQLIQYRAKADQLRKTLEELSKAYTPQHYKVKQAQAQIDELETAMKTERETVMSRLRADLESIHKRETLLSAAYARQRQSATTANAVMDVKQLQREVDNDHVLYDTMRSQLNQAGMAITGQLTNIRLVEKANPPRRPSNLNQTLYAGLGLATGLLLGFAVIVVLENVDQTVRTPGHAGILLGSRELGVIPDIDIELKDFKRLQGVSANGTNAATELIKLNTSTRLLGIRSAPPLLRCLRSEIRGTGPRRESSW